MDVRGLGILLRNGTLPEVWMPPAELRDQRELHGFECFWCGNTPSGGGTRRGQTSGDVNRYLKWAFVETANLVVIHQKHLAGRHVVRLYQRVKRKTNYQKAVVAVARHLAEAAYRVLTKQEMFREPQSKLKPSTGGADCKLLSSTHG